MSVTLTAEGRARLDGHLDAVEAALAAAGKTRAERRAIVDDVETQALEMLRAGGGSVQEVEAVLARMDRPESFGRAPAAAAGGGVLWIVRIGLVLAALGMVAATGGEVLALHVFRSLPVVDESGFPHDPKEMDPGPDHVDVRVGRPGEAKTTVRVPLAQRDTSGLHRMWGAYMGWVLAFLVTLPVLVVACVLAVMGWRRAQFPIERVTAGVTVGIAVLVVVQMVWQMVRG